MNRFTITIGALLLPSVAFAHADHASGGDHGLVHFVSDPLHMGLSVAAVALAFTLGRVLQRRFF